MPGGIGIRSLSGSVQAMLNRGYPDIGQTYYVVDANYRTGMPGQGWAQGDRTGPLDLWSERNKGYVFRCGSPGEHATDSVGIQAAIDAMVDFRGDALYFTPGAYSLAVALAVNVPDARWLGSPVTHPSQARATITDAIGSGIGLTAAADRMEIAFLRFVPLTATTLIAVATGADRLHLHDFQYDSDGIAANTATIFLVAAGTMDDSCIERFTFTTDAAAGPLIQLGATVTNLDIRDFTHFHNAGTLAISLLDVNGASATALKVGRGFGQIGGGGAVTTLVDLVNMTNASTNITVTDFEGSVGYATNTTLVTSAGAVNDIDLVNCWLATVEGGAGRAAYIGAA